MKAEPLVDASAYMLAIVDAKTLRNTRFKVNADALVDPMGDALAKSEVRDTKQHTTLAYTLGEVKTLTLSDTLKLCEGRVTNQCSGSEASRGEGRDNI